jgi:hypothetical protein
MQEQEFTYLSTIASRSALGPTQPLIGTVAPEDVTPLLYQY